MGHVYDEFERELAEWRRRYADRPRQEMIRLFLLALEREEIVSVGYRETRIARRLSVMPIPPDVRELIRHALIWVWKDEEMHSIYIRGAILKLGGLRLRVRAFLQQMAGGLGGWAGSVRQHARWADAPLSRAWATLFTWAGTALGKVPPDVQKQLDYHAFRHFCLFNVDAERTAWLCWSRLIELARDQPGLPPELIDDFRRIVNDEDRHRQIFEILAAALDDQDRLAPQETVESLAERIGAVGHHFLPRARRAANTIENPLGIGGSVWVVHGAAHQKQQLFRRLLAASGLADWLEKRARALDKQTQALRVAIKPTFMLGYHHKDQSIITDPVLLDELAGFLRRQGCSDIAVVEARNIYDRFYHHRTVHDVAEYFNLVSPHYRIVDASEEQVPHSYSRGMAQYTVSRTWRDADLRISFAKMRSHPVELAYLTVGNVEWLGARCDEFLFVERQAHRETAIMMLLDDFPPHFAIVDAYDSAADGLLGVMGCPRPPAPRRLYAGVDALAVDMVAARHMGMKDPRQSSILKAACHWFGDPTGRMAVVGPDQPVAGWRSPYHDELATILSFLAFPVYVLGSGRGALFVPEMDERAFPPVRKEAGWLRLGRRGLQAFLGLRHPRRAQTPEGRGAVGWHALSRTRRA
jgi:uncharacterized protein (DUF362 family)